MIVGEAPGEEEVRRREPFVGASGQELNRMLHDAGIARSECFLTNVVRERPPGNDITKWIPLTKKDAAAFTTTFRGKSVHQNVLDGFYLLQQEIDLVKPNVILAFGSVPTWALTGNSGIKKWRGSLLSTDSTSSSTPRKVIPAYHPAYILRDWSARQITVQDLRRAKKHAQSPEFSRPRYNFILRPSFNAVMAELGRMRNHLPSTLSVDIETSCGHITCIGIADSKDRAICIPFTVDGNPEGYWSLEEETEIVGALQRLLCHPGAMVVGQNFIYDSQYLYRRWGFVPNFVRDTMLGQHVQFLGLPKGLDFLASMYCDHYVYWKDDGKRWVAGVTDDDNWEYNCKDCVYTFEIDAAIQKSVDSLGLREQHDFQMEMFYPVLETMIRGVKVDLSRRADFKKELQREMAARESWMTEVLGHPLNPRSPLQMKRLFYEDLAQPVILSRKKSSKGNPTLDDEALKKIAKRQPLLRGLVRVISEYRSLGVFLSTFVEARLDSDSRLRCSYNIGGTETLRLSSSKDAFDSGTNLQNLPAGGKEYEEEVDALQLPNVRTLFVPDTGYTFFDADLDRADLQVVVWEIDDSDLKLALQKGIDLHCYNACSIYNIKGIPPEELIETHPNYLERRAQVGKSNRQKAKNGVHAVDYGCKERTLAITLGISVHEASKFIVNWYGAHPGVPEWHKRVETQLRTKRYVENAFGFRRYYFDRIEGLLPEALAWVPQSTVAVYINKIWLKLYKEAKDVQVLLQVHDSLAGQFRTTERDRCIDSINRIARSIVIPYDDALVIPLGVKTSEVSWGDCK